MTTNEPERKWSSTEEEIMDATYHALLEHGHTGLSISRIADEFEKSKSTLYYHYESKDELLVAFLEFVADRFETTIETETGGDPTADLDHVVDTLIPLELTEEQRQLQAVLMSLRSRAVTNDAFREQFTRTDDRVAAAFAGIIERGIEEGSFDDVDPDRIAEHVLSVVNGAMYARATTDRADVPAVVRDSLGSYLDTQLGRKA